MRRRVGDGMPKAEVRCLLRPEVKGHAARIQVRRELEGSAPMRSRQRAGICEAGDSGHERPNL